MTSQRLAASHHDVVVVGARCAGAATAMLLARVSIGCRKWCWTPSISDDVQHRERGAVAMLRLLPLLPSPTPTLLERLPA
jgi:hypothetical protein